MTEYKEIDIDWAKWRYCPPSAIRFRPLGSLWRGEESILRATKSTITINKTMRRRYNYSNSQSSINPSMNKENGQDKQNCKEGFDVILDWRWWVLSPLYAIFCIFQESREKERNRAPESIAIPIEDLPFLLPVEKKKCHAREGFGRNCGRSRTEQRRHTFYDSESSRERL